MITPKDVHERLETEDNVNLMEADLNPDDPRMGEAQFLVSVADGADELVSEFESLGLTMTNEHTPNPDMYHVAVPPRSTDE